jgi:hypothetical protein
MRLDSKHVKIQGHNFSIVRRVNIFQILRIQGHNFSIVRRVDIFQILRIKKENDIMNQTHPFLEVPLEKKKRRFKWIKHARAKGTTTFTSYS